MVRTQPVLVCGWTGLCRRVFWVILATRLHEEAGLPQSREAGQEWSCPPATSRPAPGPHAVLGAGGSPGRACGMWSWAPPAVGLRGMGEHRRQLGCGPAWAAFVSVPEISDCKGHLGPES